LLVEGFETEKSRFFLATACTRITGSLALAFFLWWWMSFHGRFAFILILILILDQRTEGLAGLAGAVVEAMHHV
jgi:hypothetical protein